MRVTFGPIQAATAEAWVDGHVHAWPFHAGAVIRQGAPSQGGVLFFAAPISVLHQPSVAARRLAITPLDRIPIFALLAAVPQNGAAAVIGTADLADTEGVLFRIAAVCENQIVCNCYAFGEDNMPIRAPSPEEEKHLIAVPEFSGSSSRDRLEPQRRRLRRI